MAAPSDNLKIDGARLWDSIMEMAKIGPGVAGGSNRQTLTDADGEGRRLFKSWCDAAGLSMGVDAMEGSDATVIEEVAEGRGMVKIGGELWSARPYDVKQRFAEGTQVRVVEIRGATALVWKE